MASETELETMIVRLLGDGSSYQHMLEQSATKTTEAAHHIEEASHKIEGFGHVAEEWGKRVLGAFTAVAEFEMLKGWFEAFTGRETTMIKLTAALEANGRAVEKTTGEYKKFAKEIAEVSLMSQGEILNLLRSAESYELTGAAAERASKAAIGIAALNEGNAETFLRISAAVEKGNIEQAMHMSRLVKQLRGVKDESEFLAKYQHLVAAGLRAAAAESESTEGQLHHLGLAIKGLKADLGETVANGVRPVISALKEFFQFLRETPSWVKEVVVALTGFSAAAVGLTTILPLLAKMLPTIAISQFGIQIGGATAALIGYRAAVVALIALDIYLIKSTYEASSAVREYNSEIERSNRLQNETIELAQKRGRESVGRIAAQKEEIPHATIAMEEITKAIADVETWNRKVERAEEEVEKLNTGWNRFTGNKLLANANRDLAQSLQSLSTATSLGNNVLEEAGRVMKENQKEVDTLKQKLIEEIDAMNMTSEEAKIHALEAKGATEGQMADLRELIAIKEDAADSKKLEASTSEWVKTLQVEAATLGMTTHEVELFKKANEGADATAIEFAKTLYDLMDAHKALDEVMKEGRSVFESVRTPQEKFTAEMYKLNELYFDSAISAETYSRAAKKAQEDLNKELNKTNKEMAQIHTKAAEFGSSEAITHIQEYAASFDQPKELPGTQDKKDDQTEKAVRDESQKQLLVLGKIVENTAKGIGRDITIGLANLGGSIA